MTGVGRRERQAGRRAGGRSGVRRELHPTAAVPRLGVVSACWRSLSQGGRPRVGRRIPKAPSGCPGRFGSHPALGEMIKKPFNQCKAMSISCRNLKTIRAFIQNRPGARRGGGPELAVAQREAALKRCKNACPQTAEESSCMKPGACSMRSV